MPEASYEKVTSTDTDDEKSDGRFNRALSPWYYVPWAISLTCLVVGFAILVLRNAGLWHPPGEYEWPEIWIVEWNRNSSWRYNNCLVNVTWQTGAGFCSVASCNLEDTTFCISIVAFLHAADRIFWSLTGFFMLPTAIFLVLNSDLVVTYIRFLLQIWHFRKNNKRFAKVLLNNGREVHRIMTTEKAFAAIEDRFDGVVSFAMQTVTVLEQDVQTELASVAGRMIRTYGAYEGPNQSTSHVNKEGIREAIAEFGYIFSGFVKDWDKRARLLKENLKKHPSFKASHSVRVAAMEDMLRAMIVANTNDQFVVRIKQIMDRDTLTLEERWKLEDDEEAEAAHGRVWYDDPDIS